MIKKEERQQYQPINDADIEYMLAVREAEAIRLRAIEKWLERRGVAFRPLIRKSRNETLH